MRGHRDREAYAEREQRVLEVLHLPQPRECLRQGGVRGDRLYQLLAGGERARRVDVETGVLLPHHADAAVDVQLGGRGIEQLVSQATRRRDQVVDLLELVFQILILAEDVQARREAVLIANIEAEAVRGEITLGPAAKKQPVRLDDVPLLRIVGDVVGCVGAEVSELPLVIASPALAVTVQIFGGGGGAACAKTVPATQSSASAT